MLPTPFTLCHVPSVGFFEGTLRGSVDGLLLVLYYPGVTREPSNKKQTVNRSPEDTTPGKSSMDVAYEDPIQREATNISDVGMIYREDFNQSFISTNTIFKVNGKE